jgi:hypothetical protein
MLSPYSSQTLAILLELLPDLAGLVSERGEVFQMELLTPAGWEFWLSSEEEDYLTVGFAEYHCHFGNFHGTTPEEDATAAAAFIRALRQGEVVLAVWYQGDTYAGSSIMEAAEKPQPLLEGRNVTVRVKKWVEQ